MSNPFSDINRRDTNVDILERIRHAVDMVAAVLRDQPERADTVERILKIPEYLSPIGTDTVDSWIPDIITNLGAESRYPPRLYETMLSEAAQLLNRCQTYRDSANRLATQAILGAFELISNEANVENQRQFLKETISSALAAQSRDYADAATLFGDADGMSKGSAALASANSKYGDAASVLEKNRNTNYEFTLDIEELCTNSKSLLKEKQGSSLNFVEQYQEIKGLYIEDLSEAYERLLAVEIGIQRKGDSFRDLVRDHPLPSGFPFQFSSLVLWVRKIMREIDRSNLFDHEIVVPLIIGGDPSNRVADKTAVENALKATGNGQINFEVKRENLPENFTDFRLLSVGLCFLSPDLVGNKRSEETRRFGVNVQFPSQEYAARREHREPSFTEYSKEVRIGAVGKVAEEGNYMEVGGPLITYSSPIGLWSLSVDAEGVSSSSVIKRDLPNITGFVVYLRMIGRAE